MKQAKQIIGYWCEEIQRESALGQGICVAVLDTGICAHPDFGKRIFGKRFLKTDYFENVYGKRIRVLRKTVLLTIERDRFDDFKNLIS